MKNQTAIQQLIDEIVEHLTYDDDLSEDSRITLETIRLRCLGKLKIEKQQIEDAYDDFSINEIGELLTGEQYYNKTFKSE
jgi:hypothetical protein